MTTLKAVNLGIRFLLELCLLAAIAYWGWHAGGCLYESVALAVVAPLAAAVAWGIFVSPKARVQLTTPAWVGLQAVLFGAAVAGLVHAGQLTPGIALGVAAAINTALVLAWGR